MRGNGLGRGLVMALGWLLIVVIGILLVWYGFLRPAGSKRPASSQPPATVTAAVTLLPTALPTALPPTPVPTNTPVPVSTAVPATPTAVQPVLVAGADGANVRTGPNTTFNRIGYLEPSSSAKITGRYQDWWQIDYGGASGWVFGQLVTASNADSVPQVQPPPFPTAAPAQPTATRAPTAVPATAVPTTPPADLRGLQVILFTVESAPGPFSVGADIWFNLNISNGSNNTIEYNGLGAWVEQTGQFQKSWTYSSFAPGQNLTWRDRIRIPTAGTYNLWLAIEFSDGKGARLRGPIQVVVQ